MSYYIDAIFQLERILEHNGNKGIVNLYQKEIEKIFCGIYIINYISNRIEFRNLFNSDYFEVSFSCLMESFSLILNNYPRGASLVLRSSLENFIKFIIQAANNDFKINDRSYTANKTTLDEIIKTQYSEELRDQSISLNSKMEGIYSSLSGLSHSLTPESKNNTMDYFSDLNIVNKEYICIVLEKTSEVITQMFSFCIIICQPSLKIWDSWDLQKIFRMVFGKSKTQTFLKMLKA